MSDNTDSSDTLYRISIQTAASPAEVQAFCALLEEEGYTLITDLGNGKLEIREGGDAT